MSVKNRLLKAGMTPDMAHFVSVPHSHNLNWDVTLSYRASRDWRGDICPCGTLPLKILAGIKPKRIPLQVKVMSHELVVTQRIQYSGKKRPCCRLKNFVCIGPEVNGPSYPLLHQCNQEENLLHHKSWSAPDVCKTKHVSVFFHLTAFIPKHLKVSHSMKEKGHVMVTRNTQHYQQHVPHTHTEFISIPVGQKNTNITHIIKLTLKHTALTVMLNTLMSNTLFRQC